MSSCLRAARQEFIIREASQTPDAELRVISALNCDIIDAHRRLELTRVIDTCLVFLHVIKRDYITVERKCAPMMSYDS